ncbi:MAG: Mpo1-like protein [Planctomycetaceae bacterium]
MIARFLRNYLPRHRNRWNQCLHLAGVPTTFVAPWVAVAMQLEWYFPVSLFFAGYVLQFIGHAIEGNDAGEVVFLKKSLGMRYTEYGPLSECSRPAGVADDRTRG